MAVGGAWSERSPVGEVSNLVSQRPQRSAYLVRGETGLLASGKECWRVLDRLMAEGDRALSSMSCR